MYEKYAKMTAMKTLRECIEEASSGGYALGHFNFATAEMLRGIVLAAKEVDTPIIVGVSEGERDFLGIKQSRALVTAFHEEFGIPIFLNADHTKSFSKAAEAIDAGFDSVVMDGSSMPYEKNVESVRETKAYAKEKGRDVVIEGELGFIGTSSQILEKLPPGVPVDESTMTKPEDAKKFVMESGADLFAPAVGNVHGIVGGTGNPRLSLNRIGEIKVACGVPLVLHGASGVVESDVRGAVKAGAAIVHFSTDLRLSFRKSLIASLSESPDELSPYKYLRDPIKLIKETVKTRLAWLG